MQLMSDSPEQPKPIVQRHSIALCKSKTSVGLTIYRWQTNLNESMSPSIMDLKVAEDYPITKGLKFVSDIFLCPAIKE